MNLSRPLPSMSTQAAYSNIRRMLQAGQLPPKGAVRLEELVELLPVRLP